jgi:hypothetical protein
MSNKIQSFAEFYPYYLSEHQNRTCRMLHVVGSTLVLLELAALLTQQPSGLWWLVLPLTGYGFAWVGHFFFEKNRPATFTYPLWSLMGDWVMFAQIMTGRLSFDASNDPE